MGLQPGILHAWTSGLLEMAAGVGLVLGFLTSLTAGAIVGIMIVAGVTAHRKNGFFIFNPGQGYEYVLLIAAVCVAISILGPGYTSLDSRLGIEFDGWPGGLVTLGIGVGGSAALLGASWRPSPPTPPADQDTTSATSPTGQNTTK
jgi:putative oxidoreductase